MNLTESFQLNRGPFPDGSQAYSSPNEAHATYVKRGEHWLSTELPNGSARASNYVSEYGMSVSQS